MRLWADECSDSCQLPLDPTIAVVLRDGDRIGVVNQLHRDLVATVGDYRVISAGDKGCALRYLVDRRSDPAVALIAAAREVSESVCTICGSLVTPANPPRCDRHPRRSTPVVIARPPGQRHLPTTREVTMTTTTITDPWIERQIRAGHLAPGARGMTREAAAEQYNAANALEPTDPDYLYTPGQAQQVARDALAVIGIEVAEGTRVECGKLLAESGSPSQTPG